MDSQDKMIDVAHRLATAAKNLRDAQRDYLKTRNGESSSEIKEKYGELVGVAARQLDNVIEEYDSAVAEL